MYGALRLNLKHPLRRTPTFAQKKHIRFCIVCRGYFFGGGGDGGGGRDNNRLDKTSPLAHLHHPVPTLTLNRRMSSSLALMSGSLSFASSSPASTTAASFLRASSLRAIPPFRGGAPRRLTGGKRPSNSSSSLSSSPSRDI